MKELLSCPLLALELMLIKSVRVRRIGTVLTVHERIVKAVNKRRV
jgi:hypothetical protein